MNQNQECGIIRLRQTQEKKNNNERPGFLLYYETLEALGEYSEAETGLFVRAMGEYARYGIIPEFQDRGLRSLWRVVQPALNRDDDAYAERCRKNRYSSYVAVVKRRYQKEYPGKEAVEGRDYLGYEDWVDQMDEANGSDRKRSHAIGTQLNKNGNENRAIAERNQKDNKNKNLNEKENGKGEPGETQSPVQLCEAWREAVKAGDRTGAYELSSQLSRMGYLTNPQTLTWKKRD